MKSTRLKFSQYVITANFIVFCFGIYHGADLSDLGTGLAMINTPLVAYVLGRSYRGSNINSTDK